MSWPTYAHVKHPGWKQWVNYRNKYDVGNRGEKVYKLKAGSNIKN
jgi:hypothetical protein